MKQLNSKFSTKLTKADLDEVRGGNGSEGNTSDTSKCTREILFDLTQITDTTKDGDWYPSC